MILALAEDWQPERLWSQQPVLSAVLLLGILAGHAALNVYGLNTFLGWPWRRRFSKVVRKFNTFWIVTAPLLILLTFIFGLDDLPPWLAMPWLAYLAVCAATGLLLAPAYQVYYWATHRRPAALASNHSEIVDVAAELGYKPIGDGKYRHLACLPWNQAFQVEFNEKHVHLADLPAVWEGLTILHLSDLHFKGIPDKEFYRRVVNRCRQWEPDLLALTGDIVDSARHHRWILPLLGRLRWRYAALAILGNHDQWYDPVLVRRRLKHLGMDVIGNGWRQLQVRGRPLIVIGHEGPWFRPEPDLADCPEGFRLCLSHCPDNIAWARRHHVDLMLSGHTHGGQIRFPWIGSVYVPSLYSRRFDAGTFHLPPTLLHVSRGLAGQHPVRYNCRPEATLLVLHQADAG